MEELNRKLGSRNRQKCYSNEKFHLTKEQNLKAFILHAIKCF
jgi:hypothetical protein